MGDISWSDGRARFQALFDALNRDHGREFATFRPTATALHPVDPAPEPDGTYCGAPFRHSIRLILIPGLGASLLGRLGEPLPDAARHVQSLGVEVSRLAVSGFASSRRNAAEIDRLVAGMPERANERIVLLGYSKGAMDALIALVRHPRLAERVAVMVSLAGTIGGSLIADDLPDAALDLLHKARRWLPAGAFRSMESGRRRAWLETARLPERVRLYSVVAHTDRRHVSTALRLSYERLRLVDPMNDGQLLVRDQIVPGSTLLAELDADHLAAALPLTRQWPWLRHFGLDANDFPREIMLEAILRLIDTDFGK